MLSGSGPINYTKIPLRSILYAFNCGTFRIISPTHNLHSLVMRFYFNILHACWKPLGNTRTGVMSFQCFTARVVPLMVVLLCFYPT
jgi:hypothetical protein